MDRADELDTQALKLESQATEYITDTRAAFYQVAALYRIAASIQRVADESNVNVRAK